MEKEQVIAVSIPNLRSWLRMGHPNALNFEHTYLLTESLAESLFESVGLQILDKVYFAETHFIFYALKNLAALPEVSNFVPDKDPVTFFKSNYEKRLNFVRVCNESLLMNSGEAFIFSGSILAQLLINLGLNTNFISRILDNDLNKHEKRLYGSVLLIEGVKLIGELSSLLIIIDCGEYNAEIKNK